jgi:hypothetical protein
MVERWLADVEEEEESCRGGEQMSSKTEQHTLSLTGRADGKGRWDAGQILTFEI